MQATMTKGNDSLLIRVRRCWKLQVSDYDVGVWIWSYREIMSPTSETCHQYYSMQICITNLGRLLRQITIFYIDMQFELDENQFNTLSLVLGYNKSDASYGWNGFEHGAELYFSHITDEIMDTAQSIPLTAGLQPVISLQNIQKTYLGSPYPACIGSFHFKRS